MQHASIARLSVPDQVARAILEFLKINKYEPGSKLPTTKTLCECFEVGYRALQEAIERREPIAAKRLMTQHWRVSKWRSVSTSQRTLDYA